MCRGHANVNRLRMGLSLIARVYSPLKWGKHWNTRCFNDEFVLVFLSCLSYVRLVSIILDFPYPYACRTYLLFSFVLLHIIL
jgi:hypothetical protein